MIKSVETFFDRSREKYPEDLVIQEGDIFGVLDGYSPVYHPKDGPKTITIGSKQRSLGQVIVNTIKSKLQWSYIDPFERTLLQANSVIRGLQDQFQLPSEERGGAAFALAKIGEEKTEIIQGADCLALWILKSGAVGFTPNQILKHSLDEIELINTLSKRRKNKDKIWRERIDHLKDIRKNCLNNPKNPFNYAAINGNDFLYKCWRSISLPTNQVSLLIMITDGFFQVEESADIQSFAKNLLTSYQSGNSFVEILMRKRIKSNKAPEAAAIAIELV